MQRWVCVVFTVSKNTKYMLLYTLEMTQTHGASGMQGFSSRQNCFQKTIEFQNEMLKIWNEYT